MRDKQPSSEGKLRLYDAATESPEFRASQVRQLHTYSRAGTMGALLALIFVTLATYEHVPHMRLIAWIAVYLAIQGPRYYLIRAFSDQYRSAADIIQWGRKFSFLTFLTGLVWGSTVIFMFPATSASEQMLVVLALAGISSAAAVVYSPLKLCYAPTVVAILLPLSLRYFYDGGATNIFIGAYIFLFTGVLLISGRLMNHFVINSLKLQFDKTDLVESLSEQKRVSDILNQYLMDEIRVRTRAEKELRIQTEKFQMLSDSAPFGMVMIAEDGTFEYLNARFKEIVGYDLKDTPNGREWMRKVFPDDAYRRQVVTSWLNNLKEHGPGETRPAIFELTCKDGTLKIVDFRPVKLSTGEDLMTCEDITERTRSEEEIKKAQAALRESEERYRAVFDNAGIGIDLVDRDGRLVQVNNALMSMLGYTEKEFYQLKFTDITHPDDIEISEHLWEKVIRREVSSFRLEKRYVKKDGSFLWGDLSASAIRDLNGEHIATVGVIADITERKQAEEALLKSEQQYRTLVETMGESLVAFDEDGVVTFVNSRFCELLGYSSNELVGRSITHIDFQGSLDQEHFLEQWKRRRQGLSDSDEASFKNRYGQRLDAIVSSSPLFDAEGHFKGSFSVITDITNRKRYEERIKASLREKEVLLREIHHRVKNNLQLMSSLLRLQVRQARRKDASLGEIFEDIQGRIMAMALVHEALYRSENLESIDASPYVQSIIAGLHASSPRGPGRVSIKTDVKNVSLGINKALKCGLIVNELVTNSLKHAFPEGRNGEIVVSLEPNGGKEFQLTVCDNGIGMPQDIDLKHPESLGLELVKDLASQIDGTVEFIRSEGTEFHVRFPAAK